MVKVVLVVVVLDVVFDKIHNSIGGVVVVIMRMVWY